MGGFYSMKQFIGSLGNFSVQFNLQVASIVISIMTTSGDVIPPKTGPFDFPQPDWSSKYSKGIVFAGAFVGMIFMGYLGDVLGRRLGMMATLSLVVLGALGCAVAPWLSDRTGDVWYLLAAMRFVLGAGVGGIYPMAAATAAEAGKATENEHGEDADALWRSSWAFFWQSPGAAAPYLVAWALVAMGLPAGGTATQATILFLIGAVLPAVVMAATWSQPAGGGLAAATELRLQGGRFEPLVDDEQEGGVEAGSGGSYWEKLTANPEHLRALVGTGGTWCA